MTFIGDGNEEILYGMKPLLQTGMCIPFRQIVYGMF